MPFFLGLDCGGTSTRAMVVDEDEKVVFEGRGGPANLASTPLSTVKASLAEATKGMPEVDAAAGCFAGLLGEERRLLGLDLLREIAPGAVATAYADFVAALGAAPDGTDIVVIAGTGSVVCSFIDGLPVKSGGGGPWLGDEGSAFDVGRRALKYFCIDRGSDSGSDEFFGKCLDTFGTTDFTEIPACLSACSEPAATLASFAPIIGADYEKDHAYAKQSVNLSMATLAHHTSRHHYWFPVAKNALKVALAGGLWLAHPVYQSMFEFFINPPADSDPTDIGHRQYHVERLDAPSVLGAARLAKLLFYEH